MRVTNSMLSNSAKSHIGSAKNKLLKYEEQFTSEKKIQRPSDDPTVATRSLRYRSTMAQITQYVEKNVKDAMSWMDTTEGALKNINSVLVQMKGYLDQGANDYLAQDERNSVLSTLQQFVSSIFEDEANSDYSGRYVFSGYRTDTPLLFGAITDHLAYDITEKFGYTDIDMVNVVTGRVEYKEGASEQDYVDMLNEIKKDPVYKVQLAYKDCSNSGMQADGTTPSGTEEPYVKLTLQYKDTDGTPVEKEYTAKTYSSSDGDAYKVGDNDVIYLYDTGEVLMGKTVYSEIQENRADFSINYCKTKFQKSDIRPELYFECSSYNSVSKKTIEYADPSGQNIDYEINFSQTMTVNTQGKDAISTEIYRAIDYLAKAIEEVDDIENRISEVNKMIANEPEGSTVVDSLKELKSSLETERSLRTTVMTEAFGKGLTMVDRAQEKLNVSLASLGTRYDRLELTYDKLSDQKVDTEEQLSNNEDVDLSDAFINLTQADNLYQYALSSTSKILGNTLLDYI